MVEVFIGLNLIIIAVLSSHFLNIHKMLLQSLLTEELSIKTKLMYYATYVAIGVVFSLCIGWCLVMIFRGLTYIITGG